MNKKSNSIKFQLIRNKGNKRKKLSVLLWQSKSLNYWYSPRIQSKVNQKIKSDSKRRFQAKIKPIHQTLICWVAPGLWVHSHLLFTSFKWQIPSICGVVANGNWSSFPQPSWCAAATHLPSLHFRRIQIQIHSNMCIMLGMPSLLSSF